MTCIALGKDGETFLLFTVDVISVGSAWASAMKTAVSNATGIARDHILISTTHTHSGVGVNYDWADHEADKTAYMEKFYAAAVSAATDAVADMAGAQVLGGSVDTEGLAFVRHTSDDAQVNQKLDLVQLQRQDKTDIVLMSFPVHATFMESGTVLSADFPGYARAYVEANYDAQVAYFIGSAGNQTPTSGDSTYEETAEDCLRYGETLGAYAVAALNSGLEDTGNATLSFTGTTTAFATNTLTEEELAKLEQAKEVKEAAETYGNTAIETKLLVSLYGFDSVYQAKAIVTRSALPEQKNMTLKVLALTRNVAFVFVPYEMFSNEGLALKAASEYNVTFIAACTEANNGYIPSDYAFAVDGCYEVQVTRWAQGTAAAAVEAYTEILKQLKNNW